MQLENRVCSRACLVDRPAGENGSFAAGACCAYRCHWALQLQHCKLCHYGANGLAIQLLQVIHSSLAIATRKIFTPITWHPFCESLMLFPLCSLKGVVSSSARDSCSNFAFILISATALIMIRLADSSACSCQSSLYGLQYCQGSLGNNINVLLDEHNNLCFWAAIGPSWVHCQSQEQWPQIPSLKLGATCRDFNGAESSSKVFG